MANKTQGTFEMSMAAASDPERFDEVVRRLIVAAAWAHGVS